jgi:hypothetical protein
MTPSERTDVRRNEKTLARIIHEGSSRARADASEPGAWSRECAQRRQVLAIGCWSPLHMAQQGGRRTLCSTLTD